MEPIIDSHVHLCLLAKHHPDRITRLIENRCRVISWAYGGNIGAVSDLKRYFSDRLSTFKELRRRGLDCCNLVGIHPRKIMADLRPEAIADLLTPFPGSPDCRSVLDAY